MLDKLEELVASGRHPVEVAWNEGDVDALDTIYDPNFVRHAPPFSDLKSLAEYKQYIEDSRRTFSDIQFSIDLRITEGDHHATQWAFRAKHTGPSTTIPIPPTGKEVLLVGGTIVHFVDDLIVEEWVYADYLGYFQQLGLVPAVAPETT